MPTGTFQVCLIGALLGLSLLSGCNDSDVDQGRLIASFADNRAIYEAAASDALRQANGAERVEIALNTAQPLSPALRRLTSLPQDPVESVIAYRNRNEALVAFLVARRGLGIGGSVWQIGSPGFQAAINDPSAAHLGACGGENLQRKVESDRSRLEAKCELGGGWTLSYSAS